MSYDSPSFSTWMSDTLGIEESLAVEIAKQTFKAIADTEKTVYIRTAPISFTFNLPPNRLITDEFLAPDGPLQTAYFDALSTPTTSPRTAGEDKNPEDLSQETLMTSKKRPIEQKVSGSWGVFFSNADKQLEKRKQLLRTQSAPDVLRSFSPIQLRKA